MLQLYSDGLTVAAGATIPLNNVTYAKGCSATSSGGTILLNKRGVYLVTVDAYGAVAAAGNFGVQIAVNGVPRRDAINQATATAVGDLVSAKTQAFVTVAQSDCPCNCTSAPTTVQIINPSDVGATDAHYNVTVSKLC